MLIYSFAKLNLSLEVYAPVSGYHPICSVFQTISLCDTLRIEEKPQQSGLILYCNHPQVPTGPTNILSLIFQKYKHKIPIGLKITLEKNIPVGGGLGGGSSNSAAFLTFLNDKFVWGHSKVELAKMGAEFGSDIPFFFTGGTACIQGIGDVINSIEPGSCPYFLLINPAIMVSSASAYKGLDARGKLPEPGEKPPSWMLENRVGFNAFKAWLWATYSEFEDLETVIKSLGAPELYVSGSGATTFLPFFNKEEAINFENKLKKRFPGYWIKLVNSQPLGSEMKECD